MVEGAGNGEWGLARPRAAFRGNGETAGLPEMKI